MTIHVFVQKVVIVSHQHKRQEMYKYKNKWKIRGKIACSFYFLKWKTFYLIICKEGAINGASVLTYICVGFLSCFCSSPIVDVVITLELLFVEVLY